MEDGQSERNRGPRVGKAHPNTAIAFGSAATESAGKRASVRATCEAIGLARSTYYYQSHRSSSTIEFEHKIVLRLHELRGLFPQDGYRRMTQQLQAEGLKVNRKRIARLMQLHGLSLKPSRMADPLSGGQRPPALANLLKTARVTRPHQIWVADISYVRVRTGLLYAAAVIDAWSRQVMGYAISPQMNTRLASIALHAAVRAHRPAPGSVHHSGCGMQYFMRGYSELIRQYGLIPSTSEVVEQQGLTSLAYAAASHPPAHEVIDMGTYENWEQVAGNAREFIQALYSPERIDAVLGRQSAATQAPGSGSLSA